ncbi:MAG: RsiV family protein [Candidatus Kapaibacterium sp.]
MRNRKLLINFMVLYFVLLISCSETTRQYRDTRINYDSLAASIPKSDTLTFLTSDISDTNTDYKYYINCVYPRLIHFDKESVQRAVNDSIENKLHEVIDLFENDQELMFGDSSDMEWPEDFDEYQSRYSYLGINYELINNSRELLSLILNVEHYTAFAAHPISYHKSLNFDMGSGEILSLENFIGTIDSSFLQNLSERSFHKIMKMDISDSVWIRDGLLPKWENFKNYNITRDSLFLTFDVYQVAPYAVGPVRLSIPWTELIEPKNRPVEVEDTLSE